MVAHNVFTNEEVFSGVLTDDPIKVPKVEWEIYEAVFLDAKKDDCRLMIEDSEDFEEIDGIKLPSKEKPELVRMMREEFSKAEAEGKVMKVDVILMFGRKQIYGYRLEQTDLS